MQRSRPSAGEPVANRPSAYGPARRCPESRPFPRHRQTAASLIRARAAVAMNFASGRRSAAAASCNSSYASFSSRKVTVLAMFFSHWRIPCLWTTASASSLPPRSYRPPCSLALHRSPAASGSGNSTRTGELHPLGHEGPGSTAPRTQSDAGISVFFDSNSASVSTPTAIIGQGKAVRKGAAQAASRAPMRGGWRVERAGPAEPETAGLCLPAVTVV